MKIQPLYLADQVWLREAIRQFLVAGVERGGDLLASPGNVCALLALGCSAARDGDPSLVARIDGAPVGFVLWVGAPSGFDLSARTLIVHGSYTSPHARGRGVAEALRMRALEIARVQGYRRVIGTIHASNTRGLEVFRAAPYDAQVHAYVMETVF